MGGFQALARHLVFLENRGLTPKDDAQRLKRLLKSIPCVKSANVRISKGHVEVDTVHSCENIGEEVSSKLGLEHIHTFHHEREVTPKAAPSLAREGRFWEAHEALETLLIETGGDRRVRALIFAFAAAAKAQEGLLEQAYRMLSKMDWGGLESIVSLECVKSIVRKVWLEGYGDLLTCFNHNILLRMLEARGR